MSTPVNVQTTGTGSLVATLTSATYTVPAGNNQRLVVLLALSLPTSTALPSGITVTHNGVAMTLQRSSSSNNANGGNNSSSTLLVYDLVLGSTTPSGTIVASWTTGARCLMAAFTVPDVDQAATPANTASQSLGTDSVASTTTSTVIDAVLNASQNTTTGYAVTIGAGQTNLTNRQVLAATANEVNLAASYANTAGASSTTTGWTGNLSLGPRAQHIVLAYAAASSGNSPAAIASTEDADTAALSANQSSSAAITATEGNDTASATASQSSTASIAATESADTASASAGQAGSPTSATIVATEADDTCAASAGQVNPVIIIDTHDGGARARQKRWDKATRDREGLRETLARHFRPVEAPEPENAPHEAPAPAPVAIERVVEAVRELPPSIRPLRMPFATAEAIAADEDDVEMLLLEAW